MIDPGVAAQINDHLPAELLAHNTYLRASLTANRMGMPNTEAWFMAQSLEERQHMIGMLEFLNDYDLPNTVPGVAPQPSDELPPSAEALFALALALEQQVTRSLSAIASSATLAGDQQSFNFIQGYIAEQNDSERTIRDIQAMLRRAGSNALEFDEALGEMGEG